MLKTSFYIRSFSFTLIELISTYYTGNKTDASNMVFQLPYVVEVYNYVKGIRTHPIRVQANDRTVMVSAIH